MSRALRRDFPVAVEVDGVVLLVLEKVVGERRWDSFSRRWRARSFLRLVEASSAVSAGLLARGFV